MRLRVIFLLVPCVLLYIFLATQLATPFEHPPFMATALLIPFGFIIWGLAIVLFRSHRKHPDENLKLTLFIQWGAFLSMGGLSILSFVVIGRLILALVFPSESLFSVNGTWGALGFSGFLLAVGMWVALSGPRIHEIKIKIPHLPKDLDGFRIAQITDLHVGPTIGKSYVEGVVDKINSTKADLVVLTGDIADGPVKLYGSEMTSFNRLEPKGKVYFVTGNHEYYWQANQWISHMESLGMKALLNSNVQLSVKNSKLTLAGVKDPAALLTKQDEGPDLDLALVGSGKSDFKILLAHQPKIADAASAAGFDLQLSGHTHGGQFFPWTLVIRKVQQYYQGIFQVGRMSLYVSPGTGSWGPPVRLGTRPEVSLIILSRN